MYGARPFEFMICVIIVEMFFAVVPGCVVCYEVVAGAGLAVVFVCSQLRWYSVC
jgi:hypothetical protein